jgi:hypothetical protein
MHEPEDLWSAYTSEGTPMGAGLELLSKLEVTGCLRVDPCHCFRDEFAALDDEAQDRDLEQLCAPVATDRFVGADPADRGAFRESLGILTGVVGPTENELVFPATAEALADLRAGRASTYSRPRNTFDASGVVEDLELILSFSGSLAPRVRREARRLHDLLMRGRGPKCDCYPGDLAAATAAEIRGWAHRHVPRWTADHVALAEGIADQWDEYLEDLEALLEEEGEPLSLGERLHARMIVRDVSEHRAGRARVGEVIRDPYDSACAAPIVSSLRDGKGSAYPRTQLLLERWSKVTPADLAQPPSVLYQTIRDSIG